MNFIILLSMLVTWSIWPSLKEHVTISYMMVNMTLSKMNTITFTEMTCWNILHVG